MITNAKPIWAALLVLGFLLFGRPAAATNIALQIERSAGGSVNSGSNVLFDSVVYSAGNISYNSVTGVVTFNEAGRYILNWWVTYQQVDADNPAAVLALSSSQGDFLEGASVSPSGQVHGVGIIDVAAAPVTTSLVNATAGTLYYASAAIVPIQATLVIVQDDVPPA